jgi:hypothetical protein
MRIISKFHDYYDCIQATGQDQGLLYLREKEEVEGWIGPILRTGYSYRGYSTGFSFDDYVVGFCGRIYPLITALNIKAQEKARRDDPKADLRVFCYTLEDMEKFIAENCTKQQQEKYYAKGYVSKSIGLQHRFMKEVFLACEQSGDGLRAKFEKKRCPLFVCRRSGYKRMTEWNACLKDYQFMKVFDPYLAYQEISMFLGGLATPEKVIPEMTDKDMVDIKGFNEWSFRKEPTKHKK